jgi:ATP-dependent DNA helicase RecG
MTDTELEELLLDIESDRTERKESLADPTKIREAICAFANDMPNHQMPGVLFIGVRDDGTCANLDITDELLRQLADMRSDGNILPIPNLTVQKRAICGCVLAAVIVQPSNNPPVSFRGRTWIRVGPRRAIASSDEERQLNEKRRFKNQPFDSQPVDGTSINDLDIDFYERNYLPSSVAPDMLKQNERTLEQRLSSSKFVSPTHPFTPTVVGVLAIGKSPADFIPGAYAQFLRIDGDSLADPIADQKECHGPLPDLLRRLDEIVEANIRIVTDITSGAVERRKPDYPVVALQQYIRNAVMHRNYEASNAPIRITWFSNRIEIQSPGGPFGQVTRRNFGQPGITDYRNPSVAEVMKTLGYVQRFGVGLQLARKTLLDNGNPEPEIQVEDNYALIIVRAEVPQ